METLLGCLGLAAGFVLLVVFGVLWRAFVLTKLWVWFILPVFPTLPTLSLAQMYGVALVVGSLTHTADSEPEPDDEEARNKRHIHRIANGFLYPLLLLTVGWIVKRYWL
jgi:hypothetical protein